MTTKAQDESAAATAASTEPLLRGNSLIADDRARKAANGSFVGPSRRELRERIAAEITGHEAGNGIGNSY